MRRRPLRDVKLYFFPVAPNPTRVRLYLAEKAAGGTAIDVEPVRVNLPEGEQNEPGHRARSPFGTVPVLELDDGSFLFESLPIIEYLEERHPEPPLIGREPAERARVRQLERIAETRVLVPVARLVHATRSPLGLPPRPEIAEDARGALPRGLRYLDGVLGAGGPFVAGARPTVADCTLQAALQFARFGKLALGLDGEHPHLARWNRDFQQRPAARSVLSL